jgi:hypothetical protein
MDIHVVTLRLECGTTVDTHGKQVPLSIFREMSETVQSVHLDLFQSEIVRDIVALLCRARPFETIAELQQLLAENPDEMLRHYMPRDLIATYVIGASGMGKTTLAKVICATFGWPLVIVSAAHLRTPEAFPKLLQQLSSHTDSALLIDEYVPPEDPEDVLIEAMREFIDAATNLRYLQINNSAHKAKFTAMPFRTGRVFVKEMHPPTLDDVLRVAKIYYGKDIRDVLPPWQPNTFGDIRNLMAIHTTVESLCQALQKSVSAGAGPRTPAGTATATSI